MKQLFYFSAEWCQPCKTLAPIMEQVAQTIPVQKVNVDYEPDVITKFGVRNIPTVILVENGQEVRRFTGARGYNDILNFINNG
jgi:thioredoxin